MLYIKEYHWAVKMPKMDHKERLALHRQFMMEKKEMLFYSDMLPEWRRLIRDKGAKFDINCFESPYSEIHDDVQKGSILVMENLKQHGFSDDVFDRTKGFDIHHAKVALEELAKFHALGYAKLNSYPGGVMEGVKDNAELCRDYLYVECANEEVQETFTASMVTGMKYQLEVAQEPGQDFVKAFHRKLEEEGGVLALRKRLYTPRQGKFNTLTHGDTHLMNIMFKYESGAPVAAAWVDIAATRFASPAGDLTYFLYSSTTPQLRSTHLEKLLGHYHDTLMTCLAQLGEDPSVYPFRELLADFDRYSFLGLINSMYIVPPFYVKKEDSIDQSDMDIDWNDKEQVRIHFTMNNFRAK